jgi:hypothetical protein
MIPSFNVSLLLGEYSSLYIWLSAADNYPIVLRLNFYIYLVKRTIT